MVLKLRDQSLRGSPTLPVSGETSVDPGGGRAYIAPRRAPNGVASLWVTEYYRPAPPPAVRGTTPLSRLLLCLTWSRTPLSAQGRLTPPRTPVTLQYFNF